MSACAVLTKETKPKKKTKETTLVLRSTPKKEFRQDSEGPPSYEKFIAASVTLKTDGLPNGFALKDKPDGTTTTVTALVHHDSCDIEETETKEKVKAEIEPGKTVEDEDESMLFAKTEKTEENIPEQTEIEIDNEAIDIHGYRIPDHKNADFNDNYIKQGNKVEEQIEISRTENDLRNYVLAEQAKGLQYKSSLKRPPYASLVYNPNETEGDSFDEHKMHFLKTSDHESGLSDIGISENEIEKSYEEEADFSVFSSLELHQYEQSPVSSEHLVCEDQTSTKQDTRHVIEKLADALLSGEVPDDVFGVKDSKEEEIAAFLADAPQTVRNMIAAYLKSKKLSCVLVSPSNFHYAYHTSAVLELKQLTSHCYEFLDENPQFDQKSLVVNCEPCQGQIARRNKERAKVMEVTCSKRSNPHFCIAFACQEAPRTNIDVIDINSGNEIYARETKRPFLCDRGFSCCSVHYNECPYVFVSGGKHKHSKQMWRYDVIVSEWKKVPNMIHGRAYHSMVAFNNSAIFVIGGEETDCIEEYSIDSRKWSECTQLNFPVESGACAVYEKKIYIFGGDSSVGRVQCFTPSSNKIETLHPLPCPVVEGHAVVFQDKIFIVSGEGQVVYFEPVTGLSYTGASQPVIRSKFCLFASYDKIYITGGRLQEESPEEESEYNYRYNMSTNAWTRTRKLPRRFPVRAFCDVHIQRRCPVVPFDKMKL